MNTDKLSSYGSRVFFAVAFVLFAVAVVGWVLAAVGVNLLIGYMPGRLVEFAAMFLVPVITVLLRQIRQELRAKK